MLWTPLDRGQIYHRKCAPKAMPPHRVTVARRVATESSMDGRLLMPRVVIGSTLYGLDVRQPVTGSGRRSAYP
ncbi:hypothetical protein J6590_022557 [Homalodisca vitripennis]|nr:hypothetical protein J6590_022557 [Homalodisca vitripennis]